MMKPTWFQADFFLINFYANIISDNEYNNINYILNNVLILISQMRGFSRYP